MGLINSLQRFFRFRCYKGKLWNYPVRFERVPLNTVATLPKLWGHDTCVWGHVYLKWADRQIEWDEPCQKLGANALVKTPQHVWSDQSLKWGDEGMIHLLVVSSSAGGISGGKSGSGHSSKSSSVTRFISSSFAQSIAAGVGGWIPENEFISRRCSYPPNIM